jgi:hypothetical protein
MATVGFHYLLHEKVTIRGSSMKERAIACCVCCAVLCDAMLCYIAMPYLPNPSHVSVSVR